MPTNYYDVPRGSSGGVVPEGRVLVGVYDGVVDITALAICFVQGGETYHHWKLFSDGPHGVSINFEKDGLLSVFDKDNGIKHGRVQYSSIKDMEESLEELPLEASASKLPFLKRRSYKGEEEYRVIYVDTEKRLRSKNYDIDLSLIKRIRLSPWMA